MTNFEKWKANLDLNDLIEGRDVVLRCSKCPAKKDHVCMGGKHGWALPCKDKFQTWANKEAEE